MPRNLIPRPCEWCGTLFVPHPNAVYKKNCGRFCSRPCGFAAKRQQTKDHFWDRVDKSGDCWIWTGSVRGKGYGSLTIDNRGVVAHRVAWELTHGPIPDGIQVCHNCPGGDNPLCVRPDHLFLGTNAENAADRKRKGGYASGDQHWSHRNAHLLPRGEDWALTHSDCAPVGESHPGAKNTEERVRAIRQLVAAGIPQAAISKMFGLSPSNVCAIVNRRIWKHVP
jgi:hypothetical protein